MIICLFLALLQLAKARASGEFVKSADYSTGELVYRSVTSGIHVSRVNGGNWVLVDSTGFDEEVLATAEGLDQEWSVTGGGTMKIFKKLKLSVGEILFFNLQQGYSHQFSSIRVYNDLAMKSAQ
jgi:hypothetical protein